MSDEQFKNFEIVEPLGHGMSSFVDKAFLGNSQVGEYYALKYVEPSESKNELDFQQKAQETWNDVRSQGIMPLLGYKDVKDGNKVYRELIYPLMPTGDLLDYINLKKSDQVESRGESYLPNDQIINVVIDNSRALDAINSIGFVYDDGHIANIYPVDRDGKHFLFGDFGEIKPIGDDLYEDNKRVRALFSATIRCLLAGAELDSYCKYESLEEWEELRDYFFRDMPLITEYDDNNQIVDIPNSKILNEILTKKGYSKELLDLIDSFEESKQKFSEMASQFSEEFKKHSMTKI